jgi:hypothetical protein
MGPFVAKDVRAEWEKIADLAMNLEVDELLTYEALDETLGRSFRLSRNPIYKATRWLEANHKRTLVPVRGEGYRVATAAEHLIVSRRHHKKSRRSLTRSQEVLVATRREDLDAGQLAYLEILEQALGRQVQMLMWVEARTSRLETQAAQQAESLTVTTERVTRIEDLLEKHGLTKS